MTVPAGHSGPVVHVRQHLEEGLTVHRHAALVAHVVFPRCPARIVPAGVVALVALLAGCYSRHCRLPFVVAVQAALQMTGTAVLFPECRIKSCIAALDKKLFARTQRHGMLKDPAISPVADDTPVSPAGRCRQSRCSRNGARAVTRSAHRSPVRCRGFRTKAQAAGGDEEYHPTHDNQALSGRPGHSVCHDRGGRD